VPPFDLELIDPTAAALEKAMADAVESANQRCKVGLMPVDRGEYRRFVANHFVTRAEGVAMWLGDQGLVETFPPTPRATLLGLAWRTTAIGRKTVRVAGRRIEPFQEHASHRFGPPWQGWPALCHLDPDHVVTRTFAGGEAEAIAICECGAVGPPAKLGWMQGRCGPCHDHLEEHGRPLTAAAGPTVLRTAGQLRRVGFTPSGNSVAAVEWGGPREAVKITVWDRQTGACSSEGFPSATEDALPPDRVATGLPLLGPYRIVCWVGEAGQGPVLQLGGPPSCTGVTFKGTTATAVGYDGAGWRRNLTTAGDWESCWPERRTDTHIFYSALALAPRGTTVALGRTECLIDLFDWPGSGEGLTLRPEPPVPQSEYQRIHALAFSPDGKLLAAGAGKSGLVNDPSEDWFGRGGGLYLYDVDKGEQFASLPAPRDDLIALAFSPDGSLLFVGSTDCTVRVIDVASRQELAVLSGHVGGVNALAFSPDGNTLASAGGDGLVRLWPWRQVLMR
jgi:hypothetical protein